MKRSFILILFSALITVAYGQIDSNKAKEKIWTLKGVGGINLSQTSLSNWSSGGENSMASNVYLNGSLQRKKGNWLWMNTLLMEYGLTHTASLGNRKSIDNMNITTQMGYTTNECWYYTVMGDFRSQFYKGYNYLDEPHFISNFFAPAYLNLSLGIEYRKEKYSIYLSPIAARFTFVEDNYLSSIGAFGVNPGDKQKLELGAYLKARAKQHLMENVNIISTLDLFTSYDKSFGNVDINWDVMVSMKINKYLSATFNTTLIYDNDVKTYDADGTKHGAKIQFKEILGVGMAYDF